MLIARVFNKSAMSPQAATNTHQNDPEAPARGCSSHTLPASMSRQ
tara:strand:- start:677 stop:811 length:135 start_codon:yes stop_codon:yes gene_type:complete